jgi:hypothetical protein
VLASTMFRFEIPLIRKCPKNNAKTKFAPFLNPSVQVAAICLIKTAGFWAE